MALALLGGAGRPARGPQGLISLALASAFANLVAKPLTSRRRPERREAEELASRHVQMPRSSSFPSGHAASAFAFATGAAGEQPMLSVPLRALATLVGYSQSPHRCPLSGGRARRRVHRSQRGRGDWSPAGRLTVELATGSHSS